jgi:hypothetical protein
VRGILRDPAMRNPVAIASNATPVVKKGRIKAVGRWRRAWVPIAVVYDASAWNVSGIKERVHRR